MKTHRQYTANQLLFGDEWACAHGDAGGLCDVARQLAARVPESMRSALTEVRKAAVTNGDPFARWAAVRPSIVECLRVGVDDDRAIHHC